MGLLPCLKTIIYLFFLWYNIIKFWPSPSSVLKILAESYILSIECKITDRSSQLVFAYKRGTWKGMTYKLKAVLPEGRVEIVISVEVL